MTSPRTLLAMIGAGILVSSALDVTAAEAKQPLQVHLVAQNASGETGTATMLDGPDGLIIKLRMSEETLVQPAHIHKGTCAKLDPKPAYALPPVKLGTSQTTVANVTTADLTSMPYAINVHKSAAEVGVYVACVDLVAQKL